MLMQNTLSIHPAPSALTERVDYFGNILSFFTVEEPHTELIVEAKSQVRVDRQPISPSELSRPWEVSAGPLADGFGDEGLAAYQFQFASPRVRLNQEFAAYALESFTPGRPMREALMELTSRIYTDFRFDSKATNVRTAPEEVFRKRHGV
jgi:transglutaminase-like putative cysteine protease